LFDEKPGRDIIDQAEDLILRIREIQSCRIVTDDSGSITEIHVVAVTGRQPKMIARDVETCLKAQLGLAVDYRKIGVVIIDAPADEEDPPAGGSQDAGEDPEIEEGFDDLLERRLSESEEDDFPAAAGGDDGDASMSLEFLEEDVRVRFRGLSLTIDDTRVDAEVRLERNGIFVTGSLGAFRRNGPVYETIAGAAIHAITELLDERFHLCLAGIREVELAGQKALVASVELIEDRTMRTFTGSALAGRDPNEAAVLAVLDAINRPFGRWKSRREIHYRIK
jgi:hypothetical protein